MRRWFDSPKPSVQPSLSCGATTSDTRRLPLPSPSHWRQISSRRGESGNGRGLVFTMHRSSCAAIGLLCARSLFYWRHQVCMPGGCPTGPRISPFMVVTGLFGLVRSRTKPTLSSVRRRQMSTYFSRRCLVSVSVRPVPMPNASLHAARHVRADAWALRQSRYRSRAMAGDVATKRTQRGARWPQHLTIASTQWSSIRTIRCWRCALPAGPSPAMRSPRVTSSRVPGGASGRLRGGGGSALYRARPGNHGREAREGCARRVTRASGAAQTHRARFAWKRDAFSLAPLMMIP
jgi:hypothetical protein